MFKARLFSSLVLAGLLAVAVRFELNGLIFLMIAFFGLVSQWEFYSIQEAKKKNLKVFKRTGVIAGALYFLLSYLQLDGVLPGFTHGEALETGALILVILIILGRQVFEKNQQMPVSTIALTLLGFIYVPYLFHFTLKIIFQQGETIQQGILLALYLVVLTKSTDIGAYVVGSLVGRHKMIPHISPGKTWEGLAGGLLLSLGLSLLLVHLLPVNLGFLSGWHAWVLGLLLPMTSVVGDLVESVIKRDASIKDSGKGIPGIGGGLDLIDSLLFTAPILYAYLAIQGLP